MKFLIFIFGLVFSTLSANAQQNTKTASDFVCSDESCVCEIQSNCPIGQYCSADKSCKDGCLTDENCDLYQKCSGTECVDLCTDGKASSGELCSGTTPNCFVSDEGHTSYCGCSETSCYDAMECVTTDSKKECVPCAFGKRCNCPTGYKSNGAGLCITCDAGETCNCPKGKITNNSGECVVCNTDTDCPHDNKCINPMETTSRCEKYECKTSEFAADHTCQECATVIEKCTACINRTTCTECSSGYTVSNSLCVDCKVSTGDDKCDACIANKCTSCTTGYEIKDGRCMPIQCVQGTFLSGNVCLPCPTGCSQCVSMQECLACEVGYEPDENKRCSAILCENGSFLRDNFCITCMPKCASCKDGETCDTCVKGYYFNEAERACVERICEKGSYKDSETGECIKCSDPKCEICTADLCFGCEKGYSVINGKCSPTSCPENCATCSTPEMCTACNEGYELIHDVCEKIKCPDGQFAEGSVCKPCGYGCSSCTDEKTCQVCESNEFYLSQGLCRPCYSALSNCKTCADSYTCLSCMNGLMLNSFSQCR